MTNLQNIADPFLHNRMPINIPGPFELCPVLVPEVHPDEIVFKPREPTNDAIGLSDVQSYGHHPRWREGNVVAQKGSSRGHLCCDGIKRRLLRNHQDPIDTLGYRFVLRSALKLFDEVLQHLSDEIVWICAFFVVLEPFVQRLQEVRVNVNGVANVQEVVPKQGLELKGDLPIGLAEKFRQAVELGLSEEVLRLDFNIHRCRTREASPVTEILDLDTGLVFVEVEDDLVNVRCYASVGRI